MTSNSAGVPLNRGFTVGSINGALSNGNAVARVGYGIPNWDLGSHLFAETIDDAFGHCVHSGLVVDSGEVRAHNLDTDDGDPVTATADPAPGLRLTGWKADGKELPETGNTLSLTVTGDHTIIADFA